MLEKVKGIEKPEITPTELKLMAPIPEYEKPRAESPKESDSSSDHMEFRGNEC